MIFTLKAIKVSVSTGTNAVVSSETRECFTTYDWGNFNTDFRKMLDEKQISYDYVVCDDDYELFDELERNC